MAEGTKEDWVKVIIPANGVFGNRPVTIKVPRVCVCGDVHKFDAPNPQHGDWYTTIDDPCSHTITYTKLWELKIG
jgi:hypothetical protein